MHRIALHQSVVAPLGPVGLVEVARRAGLDAVGLRVAADGHADVEHWWSRGVGSPALPALVDALLAARVTVLDVGRVPLGPELCVVDIGHPYGRVLELGTRLGAQFITVRAGAPGRDDTATAELFARLAELAGRYHLRPLLSPAVGTAVATLEQALAVVDGTDGGVVLDVVPGRDTATEVDETVVELGERLGYVRVAARALAHTAAPGLLATLPPQVPVAISGTSTASGPSPAVPARPDAPALGAYDPDVLVEWVSAQRRAVDGMLRHPQATAPPSAAQSAGP